MVCHSLYDRRMRVGISLLTLVPGLSGGSETYARELCRALVRVGGHRYEVLVPTLAPEAGGGLETVVATRYPAATTIPRPRRAIAGAERGPDLSGSTNSVRRNGASPSIWYAGREQNRSNRSVIRKLS